MFERGVKDVEFHTATYHIFQDCTSNIQNVIVV